MGGHRPAGRRRRGVRRPVRHRPLEPALQRTVTGRLPADRVERLLSGRDGVVLESPGPEPGSFDLAEGPVAAYRRTVEVGAAGPDGLLAVRQVTSFRVGVPGVSWLFALPLRRQLGALEPRSSPPWWAPPRRLAHRAAVTLAAVCGLSVLAGYLGNLLPSTMTYAGREYHVGDTGQGVALALVQVSAVVALVLLARADRRGRRRVILLCTVLGAAASATGALSPSVAVLAVTQVVASSLLTAQYVLLGVMVIEEMPAGARAWALALVTMCYELGGGFTLLALPLADFGRNGWRWLYLLSLLAIPAVAACARHLPESRRWQARPPAPAGDRASPWGPGHRRRLAIIGAGALLFALFDTPAGQFQNQYLRTQRHWSAARISVTEQITGTIGGVGTLVGGRLADTRGRRPVLAVGLGVGALVTLLQYFAHGNALYGAMTLASLLGDAVAPALAVYGGELFPTALRGRAGGLLTVLGAAGGLAGLAATGVLSDAFGTIGPALAILTAGPLAVIVLVVLAYPETARASLESLNPGDQDPA